LYKSQWMAFIRSLSIFDKAKWVNFPAYTYLAEIKAYQLSIASKYGFRIPKTRIGNNCNEFNSLMPNIIAKSLDTILLKEKHDCLFNYTTLTNREFIDEEVFEVPFTVQEYLKNKIDIRVTVVGNSVIPVSITKDGKGIDEDWRIVNKNKLEFSDIDLPKEIKKACLELTKDLKLNFAGIDLIQTPKGYFFIEINPTGEWGWLVNKNRRIDKLIANVLIQ